MPATKRDFSLDEAIVPQALPPCVPADHLPRGVRVDVPVHEAHGLVVPPIRRVGVRPHGSPAHPLAVAPLPLSPGHVRSLSPLAQPTGEPPCSYSTCLRDGSGTFRGRRRSQPRSSTTPSRGVGGGRTENAVDPGRLVGSSEPFVSLLRRARLQRHSRFDRYFTHFC